jgi:hypothetical protein
MRLPAFFLLLFLFPFTAVWAQGDIHRCIGADGRPVFTDRVCSDLDAKPVLSPAPASTASAALASPVLPPPPVLCAKDMEGLKQAVVDAFAARNPNRLAGLMLWNGAGRDTVVVYIRALSGLMAHPLLEVDADADESAYDEDEDDASSASTSRASGQGGTLVVQAGSDDSGSGHLEARFDIIRHAGCLWLRPQG